jgi:hypothetical protein
MPKGRRVAASLFREKRKNPAKSAGSLEKWRMKDEQGSFDLRSIR